MTAASLETLEPRLVWEHFLELTRIARPPKEEDAARAHVLAWAEERGFPSAVDEAGNAVVRVPASAGRDGAPTVVLQSHLDMVCERDPDSPFDPRAGRIKPTLDGDWVAAEGTTLGADDGIGVAAALAVADDAACLHGPLELLFTVSEEQGLEGAKALDPGLVTGRLLLNLDGAEDGITIGCAGSIHVFVRFALDPAPGPVSGRALEVRLTGGRGGHSGEDIAAGRMNANKALGRVLARMHEETPLRLAAFDGGVSRNAIPRAAAAIVAVPETARGRIRAAGDAELATLCEQFGSTDDALALSLALADRERFASEEATSRLLDLLAATPSGVLAMTHELPGTVETSTCLTVVGTEDGVVTLGSMIRSSSAQALEDTAASFQALARLGGAEIELRRSYPPWRPDRESRLLRTASASFERVFGKAPRLTVVHGGLECAVIGEKLPGMEMISIGPQIEGPHAPGERLNVPSTARFYRLLSALLADLS